MLASNTNSAFADRKVWTGIAYESSGLLSTINWTTSSDTCSNWTDENAIGGLYGISDGENSDGYGNAVISVMGDSCSVANHLYCVEQ